ncbi:MAG: stage II sporulation protein P [Bacillota bacterium]|nr:stage II sporulation protein P [Bacillota bacterium]
MGRKDRAWRGIWLNMVALGVFLLALPLFFRMGGGIFAVGEMLPGQAAAVAFFPIPTEEETKPLIDSDGVEFTQKQAISAGGRPLWVTEEELGRMQEADYLRRNYYIVDSRTALLSEDVDVPEALGLDLTIPPSQTEPKILIFHTHAHEGYADSDMSKGLSEGIWGVGEELKRILEEEYGIAVLHDDGQYDMVNGKGQTTGAYERMEPPIRALLEKYPSIEVCIDLHRDGVPEGTRLVAEVDGELCAQVMFFNGLCRLNKNGTPQPIAGLENPYLKENLAFSLQMKTAADALYPSFARKIYLNAYRFSLHMLPRSTLIEVGAQTNTKAEARKAMQPLAEILAKTLLEG